MNKLTYKAGNVYIGDVEAGIEVKACVAIISAYIGENPKEVCDSLNNILQTTENFCKDVGDVIKKLGDVGEDEEI